MKFHISKKFIDAQKLATHTMLKPNNLYFVLLDQVSFPPKAAPKTPTVTPDTNIVHDPDFSLLISY